MSGYGVLDRGKGLTRFAHRIVYTTFFGSLSDNLVIDHLCENKNCVNPFHLEEVTSGENVKRAMHNKYYYRTHCANGHSLSEFAVYYGKSKRMSCIQCRREKRARGRN